MGYGGKFVERERARELRAQSRTLQEIAAELGVSKGSVSVWVRDVDFVPKPRNRGHSGQQPHPLHVKKLAEIERCRVEAAGIHWLLVGPEGMHVTSPDPEVRERTAQYLQDLVRFGIEIGGTMMVVGSPQQRDIREGVNYEDAWA